jgi:hypothetical protein
MIGGAVVLIIVLVIANNLAIAPAVASYGARKGFPICPGGDRRDLYRLPLVLLAVALMPPRQPWAH